jgi:hypothetical protein
VQVVASEYLGVRLWPPCCFRCWAVEIFLDGCQWWESFLVDNIRTSRLFNNMNG